MVRPEIDLKGWHSHIDGAVALITWGRRKLFRREISRELFLAVRELMVRVKVGMKVQLLTFDRQLNTLGPQKHPTVGSTGGSIESRKMKSRQNTVYSISMWRSSARITTKLQLCHPKQLATPKLWLNF